MEAIISSIVKVSKRFSRTNALISLENSRKLIYFVIFFLILDRNSLKFASPSSCLLRIARKTAFKSAKTLGNSVSIACKVAKMSSNSSEILKIYKFFSVSYLFPGFSAKKSRKLRVS